MNENVNNNNKVKIVINYIIVYFDYHLMINWDPFNLDQFKW